MTHKEDEQRIAGTVRSFHKIGVRGHGATIRLCRITKSAAGSKNAGGVKMIPSNHKTPAGFDGEGSVYLSWRKA